MVLFPLSLAASSSCASGGSETGGEGGLFEGGSIDTGLHREGSPDSKPPPLDGGPDSYLVVDTGVDTGHDSISTDSSSKDSGAGDTSKPKDSGAKDTAPPDTGTCVAVTVSDAGGVPPTTCPATGTTCGSMTSIAGFTPTSIPPTPATTTSCTTAEITAIYDACLNQTTQSTAACTKIQTTDATCYGCIFTDEGAASYGPVISSTNGGLVFLNQAGCIDLLEPCNDACAVAYQAAFQCENAACEGNCPTITTMAESQSYQYCVEDAGTCDPGGCDEYLTEFSNCGMLLTGASHPASVCAGTSASTFATLFKAIVPVFCGP
jgi:hypothetical protein